MILYRLIVDTISAISEHQELCSFRTSLPVVIIEEREGIGVRRTCILIILIVRAAATKPMDHKKAIQGHYDGYCAGNEVVRVEFFYDAAMSFSMLAESIKAPCILSWEY
jgi:hypothetical protein